MKRRLLDFTTFQDSKRGHKGAPDQSIVVSLPIDFCPVRAIQRSLDVTLIVSRVGR
jgi:hypothetical protein